MQEPNDPYAALGVRPFINCCSTRTVHGGSIMLPEVRARMEQAADSFVNLNELMEGAGARIAELTGAEWGIVTCGSAAAIATGTAAAIAGHDPARILRLPRTDGMANGVVMLRSHRFPYDQAIRMVGSDIVEVDTVSELEALDFSEIAMIAVLGSRDPNSAIRMEDFVRVARLHDVPVLVDAASEHIQRPNPWLARGADLVVYSGGKFLRGPQTSGLLLGRKDLVRAAWANSAPHRAFGRPMKVGKEDVIGLLTALELWFQRDREQAFATWQADLSTIAAKVTEVPGCTAQMLPPDDGDEQPQLEINWNDDLGMTPIQLRQQLLDGTPRIMLDDVSALDGSIVIEPFSLLPGEAEIVGDKILGALLAGSVCEHVGRSSPAQIAGEWLLDVNMISHVQDIWIELTLDGDCIRGTYSSETVHAKITGQVIGNKVTFNCEDEYQAALMTFRFTGLVEGENMHGNVQLGSATNHTRGDVSYSQYGSVVWNGRRL
jgi:D-glucosaminate-6-phosphate ammonia-lyase